MAINIQPPKKEAKRLGLDSLPPVTADEALEHMVHHLQLAAIYYQNTSEDEVEVRDEMTRIFQLGGVPGWDDPSLVAARSWFATITMAHETLKKEQGDR